MPHSGWAAGMAGLACNWCLLSCLACLTGCCWEAIPPAASPALGPADTRDPEHGLLPRDPCQRAEVLSWLFFHTVSAACCWPLIAASTAATDLRSGMLPGARSHACNLALHSHNICSAQCTGSSFHVAPPGQPFCCQPAGMRVKTVLRVLPHRSPPWCPLPSRCLYRWCWALRPSNPK